MESGGDHAMGTPGKKKGGRHLPMINRGPDLACKKSPPFNTSTVGRPDSPAWGAAPSNAISRLRNSQGAIIGYPW